MNDNNSINSEQVSRPPEDPAVSTASMQVPLAPDGRKLSIRVHLDALDPQYDQTILAEFTIEWINRVSICSLKANTSNRDQERAQWPATADPRVVLYMHEHDLYLHNTEFEDDSKIL